MHGQIQRISSLDDDRVELYRNVRDAELVGRRGVFMAEGRLVVRTLLGDSGFRARSLLVTPPALESIQDALEACREPPAVFVADQPVMDGIVGFHIHRGCLAAGERGRPLQAEHVLKAGGPALVLEGLTNHDNVGGIFRNALAFGVRAVLLCPRSCDPLYRKAIRVSMGATLRVPFSRIDEWPRGLDLLGAHGIRTIALTPDAAAHDIREIRERLGGAPTAAVLLGSEGEGLSRRVMERVDVLARIPMVPGVDSLNVATAAGIALHELFGPRPP